MNYELAKKLRNRGYPQEFSNQDIGWFALNIQAEKIHFPDLQELLNELGGSFRKMKLIVGKNGKTLWQAQCRGVKTIDKDKKPITTPDVHSEGSTATEAIAFLWLALHKK